MLSRSGAARKNRKPPSSLLKVARHIEKEGRRGFRERRKEYHHFEGTQ